MTDEKNTKNEKGMNTDAFEELKDDVDQLDIPEEDKQKIFKNLLNLKNKKINLLITGATGVGKSSTINALFKIEVAKVGTGVNPETMDIAKYELKNLILWDSPGLGDGVEKDKIHAKNIREKLMECDENGDPLIDLVLVILDGGSRDLGTSFELINSVIIPNLGENKDNRILVAINQCDMAMKGQHWDSINNKPDETLTEFLDEKVQNIKQRIKEGSGIDINPIYYSAGFKYKDYSRNPYNLSKLLYYIIKYTPTEKRLTYIDNISEEKEVWQNNDDLEDYGKEIKKSFLETIEEHAAKGADIGEKIGSVMGPAGKIIGRDIGERIGTVVGIIKGIKGLFS